MMQIIFEVELKLLPGIMFVFSDKI